MKTAIWLLCLMIAPMALGADAAPQAAQQDTPEKTASLEKQVMSLNADLQILEEDLLYPASSRVAVYLAMDVGKLFKLDAITVKLNGDEIAHYLYTRRELNALYRGGVQRLYVGNAPQGKNRLTAFFYGIGPHGREYKRAATVNFKHSFEPMYVKLNVTDSVSAQQPEFSAKVH